jgi:hypothetical protein
MKRTFSDGTNTITMTAEEFLTRICALIAPPRVNLTRYHGQFAARARGRAALTGSKSRPRTPVAATLGSSSSAPEDRRSPEPAPPPHPDRPPRLPWADLLKRVWELDVRTCSRCGGKMQILAYLTGVAVIARILDHLGLPSRPPPRGPPRPRPHAVEETTTSSTAYAAQPLLIH